MRKLLAPLIAMTLVGGTLLPGIAIFGEQTSPTPVVAASQKDLVVDASQRDFEKVSRSLLRTTETVIPSKAAQVQFVEPKSAITAVPKPKPKVTKKPKKVTKVIKVIKPKVVKKKFKPTAKKAPQPLPKSRSGLGGIEAVAAKYYGVPYVWGGNTPSGFDCSGFTRYVYRQFGISLPRVSRDQYSFVKHITRAQAKPGDLVFYGSPIHHVAIYVGDGYMIDAPRRGSVVSKRKVYTSETPKFGRVP